ncbi:MAG: hypothetical protein AWU57_36 [Marinobacter sp. T13-3]|nr:MAG: hypothetical protein AWU57_36 [Marinobacter sp. T13-3]
MAVHALYYSDKDGLEMASKNPDKLLFTTKAEADARDRMLELAENIQLFLEQKVEGLSEEMAEACAMALAEEKELLAKAFKKPSVLADHMAEKLAEKDAPTPE